MNAWFSTAAVVEQYAKLKASLSATPCDSALAPAESSLKLFPISSCCPSRTSHDQFSSLRTFY